MKKLRILIVEDEAITAADLKHQLMACGYEVTGIAGTTSEAVQFAAQEKPDLVLMDITLAGELDGVSAALVIRGTYDLPVIFLTAHADAYTIDRAKLTGAFDYLLKPFELAELKRAIEAAVEKHRTELARKS